MAFRAGIVFRLAASAELASIHVEERPREASSCEINRNQASVLLSNRHRFNGRIGGGGIGIHRYTCLIEHV